MKHQYHPREAWLRVQQVGGLSPSALLVGGSVLAACLGRRLRSALVRHQCHLHLHVRLLEHLKIQSWSRSQLLPLPQLTAAWPRPVWRSRVPDSHLDSKCGFRAGDCLLCQLQICCYQGHCRYFLSTSM